MKNNSLSILGVFFLVTIQFSCGLNHFLKKDEFFVHKNEIILKKNKKEKIPNQADLSYQLHLLSKPKPNKRMLFFFRPKVWAYFKTYKNDRNPQTWKSMLFSHNYFQHFIEKDSTTAQEWVMRKYAEKPSLVDTMMMKKAAKNMEYYLNNKGYFYATVKPSLRTKPHWKSKNGYPVAKGLFRKKPKVIGRYEVVFRNPLLMDTIFYNTKDTNIIAYLNKTEDKSYLRPNNVVEKTNFDKERSRIVSDLRNIGYPYFFQDYISYEADSVNTTRDNRSNVFLNISLPQDSLPHTIYTVDSVFVDTDYQVLQANYKDTIIINKTLDDGRVVRFYFLQHADKDFEVFPRRIVDKIFIHQGDLFKQADYNASIGALNNLGIYKFVSINYQPSKAYPNKLNYNVRLTRNKRMVNGFDFDFHTGNNSILATTGSKSNLILASLLGYNFRHRNLLKGGENLLFNLGLGFEFTKPKSAKFYNSAVDLTTGLSLYIPRWSRPYKQLLRPFQKQNVINPQTRIGVNFFFQRRYKLFDNQTFSIFYDAEWKKGANISRSFSLFNISFLKLDLRDEAYFENLPASLRASLNDYIIPSFFRFSHTYNSPKRENKYYTYFNYNIEAAGNIAALLDGVIVPDKYFILYNAQRGNTPSPVTYSQYIRGEIDGRFFKDFSDKSMFAGRAYTGVGYAYSWGARNAVGNVLPYNKQFFVGGTNSMRGWRVRDLGIGGDTSNISSTTASNQTGDIKIEINAEVRFPLVSYLRGALFVDMGNIWTFRGNELQKFSKNFLNQMAIAAGFGIRFDISFFVIRLDYGHQIRRPYPYLTGSDPTRKSHWIDKTRLFNPTVSVWNLGIGYPF